MADAPPHLLLKGVSQAIDLLSSTRDTSKLKADLANLKHLLRTWGDRLTCAYPLESGRCSNKSVGRSHTIQSAALSAAFGRDPITPRWDGDAGQFTVESAPVSSLSIFPGYCPEHEASAFAFENHVELRESIDFLKQLMRVCHRELWLERNHQSFLTQLQVLWGDVGKVGTGTAVAGEAVVWTSTIGTKLADKNAKARHLSSLALRLERGVTADVAKLPQGVIALPQQARSPFAFHSAVMWESELLLVCLVPNGDGSLFLGAFEPGSEDLLNVYVSRYLGNRIDMTLELWIRDGTLDWYASPEWWSSLTANDRNSFLSSVNSV